MLLRRLLDFLSLVRWSLVMVGLVVTLAGTAILQKESIVQDRTEVSTSSLFSAHHLVVLTELLKFLASAVGACVFAGRYTNGAVQEESRCRGFCSMLQISFWIPPAGLYALGAAMGIFLLKQRLLDVGSVTMICQAKILYTAWLMRFGPLNKRFTILQWLAIFLLIVGVVTTQIAHVHKAQGQAISFLENIRVHQLEMLKLHNTTGLAQIASIPDLDVIISRHGHGAPMDALLDFHMDARRADEGATSSISSVALFGHDVNMRPEYFGIILACGSALVVAVANVYVEWLYKRQGTDGESILVQNTKLYLFTSIVAVVGLLLFDGDDDDDAASSSGALAVLTVALSATSGLLTSLVMKYLSNMLVVFADALATLLLLLVVSIGGMYKTESVDTSFNLRPSQFCGALITVLAIFLYLISGDSRSPDKDDDVERKLNRRSLTGSKKGRTPDEKKAHLQRHRHHRLFRKTGGAHDSTRQIDASSPAIWSLSKRRPSINRIATRSSVDDSWVETDGDNSGTASVSFLRRRRAIDREDDPVTVSIRRSESLAVDDSDSDREDDVSSETKPLLAERRNRARGETPTSRIGIIRASVARSLDFFGVATSAESSETSRAHDPTKEDEHKRQRVGDDSDDSLSSEDKSDVRDESSSEGLRDAHALERAESQRFMDRLSSGERIGFAKLRHLMLRLDAVFEAKEILTETPEQIQRRDALRKFYKQYNPNFVRSAEDVLMRHRGLEDVLVSRLRKKYRDAKIPVELVRAAENARSRESDLRAMNFDVKIIVTMSNMVLLKAVEQKRDDGSIDKANTTSSKTTAVFDSDGVGRTRVESSSQREAIDVILEIDEDEDEDTDNDDDDVTSDDDATSDDDDDDGMRGTISDASSSTSSATGKGDDDDLSYVVHDIISLMDLHEMKYPEQDTSLVTVYVKRPSATSGKDTRGQRLRRFTFRVSGALRLIKLVSDRILKLRSPGANAENRTTESAEDHLGSLRDRGSRFVKGWLSKAEKLASSSSLGALKFKAT